MSWKRRAERAYHHGNLREALIQAARELIKEKGPAGFTFADAARSAGVSAAAPYRHFRDREALLADVAREGFQRFEGMLSTGWAGGKPDALTAFNNVGKAYLAFARAEPAYYAAMFESGLPPDLNADLRAAADRAFGVLRTAANSLVAMLPATKRPPALMMSLHVWSMAHGIASLFGRGDAGRRTLPMTAEELLEWKCSFTCRGWVFPKKPEGAFIPRGGMPNVNVVNIYIVNADKGAHHDGPDGKTGRHSPARLDRPGGRELHRVLADRPRPSHLSEMEWTHVLLEAWPLRPLVRTRRPQRGP